MKKVWICAPLLGVLLGGCDRQMRFSPVDMWNRSRYKPLEPEPFFPDGSSSRTIPVGTVARGQLRVDETLYAGRKRGTGVAPADLDYGWLGNGGNIRGTFNGAGPAGTRNDLDREGDLSSNGEGRSNNSTGARGINNFSGSQNTMGGMTTTASGGATSNNVAASVGGDGVNRAVGDNALGNATNLATEFPLPITATVLSRGQERFNIYCSPCHGAAADGNGMIVQRGFPAPPSFHIQRLQNAPVGHYFDVITHGYGAMYSYASRVEPRDRWAIIAYIRLLQQSRLASGVKTPQYDTPRSYPSPGAQKLQGSNRPGMTEGGAAHGAQTESPGVLNPEVTDGGTSHARSEKVRPNSGQFAQSAVAKNTRGTLAR